MFRLSLFGSLLALLLTACPSPNRPSTFPINTGEQWRVEFGDSKNTKLEFSMAQAAKLGADDWWYARFTTSSGATSGSALLPSDRKALVLLFNLDQQGADQLACIVPNGASISGTRGQGLMYQNQRRTAKLSCSVTRLK
jgi:hypothetical protein